MSTSSTSFLVLHLTHIDLKRHGYVASVMDLHKVAFSKTINESTNVITNVSANDYVDSIIKHNESDVSWYLLYVEHVLVSIATISLQQTHEDNCYRCIMYNVCTHPEHRCNGLNFYLRYGAIKDEKYEQLLKRMSRRYYQATHYKINYYWNRNETDAMLSEVDAILQTITTRDKWTKRKTYWLKIGLPILVVLCCMINLRNFVTSYKLYY
eukprot:578341_1